MRIRIIVPIVFSCLILIVVGCVGPNAVTGENKTSIPEKDSKEVENIASGVDDAQKFVPGQVLVKLKDGIDVSALDILARDLGLETIKPLTLPGVYLMAITGVETVESVVGKLKSYNMVEYGEPNYKMKME